MRLSASADRLSYRTANRAGYPRPIYAPTSGWTEPKPPPLLAWSGRTAFGEGLEASSQLQDPVGIGFAQADTIIPATSAPFEPGDLCFIEVAVGAHAEKRLELSVEDGHLSILTIQMVIGTDSLLIGRFGLGAVEASGLDWLPCCGQ